MGPGAQAGRRRVPLPHQDCRLKAEASTAAEDKLALSSGAKFWAAGRPGRPQDDLGPRPVAAATTPSA